MHIIIVIVQFLCTFVAVFKINKIMKTKKIFLTALLSAVVALPTFAGGILTNSNQSVQFMRMFARGAVIDVDGVYFNPAVAQGESMVQSLYDPQNEWGYYGDIHCYYYNNLLYMFHLLDAPQWAWFCKTTTDMFRFYDSGYDDSFVENHYMAYGKRPDVLDYNQYKSARDCTYFFDEDVQK